MLTICIVMICQVLGLIGLLSLPILAGSLYLQGRIILEYYAIDQKRRTLVDQRSSIVNEIVVGIQHIKFNASEKILMKKVEKIRKEERGLIRAIIRCLGINQVILLIQVPMTCLICLAVYCLWHRKIELTTVYTFSLYVTSIKSPLCFMEQTLGYISSMMVSLKRVCLIYNQIEDYKVPEERKELLNGHLEIKEASLSWDDPRYEQVSKGIAALEQKEGEKNQKSQDLASEISTNKERNKRVQMSLKGVNLFLQPGELCYIVGGVGSGKSSLLSVFLDVMNKVTGEISRKGSIAYIPQEPFMINDTLKNNILFGKEYNEKRYYKTIDICQLAADLEVLPAGDKTEIGERGVNLSGGQKQRVAIARAVYSDSDIYLIDDCLSALDAEVGKAVLEKVILGELRKKTRLMVTHFYNHFKDSDRVVLMKDGAIEIDGSFDQTRATKEFSEYAKELDDSTNDNEDTMTIISQKSSAISSNLQSESSGI